MGIIDAARRKALPAADFGLPGRRAFPMPDASHAANAKARATQGVNKGTLTPSQKAQIDAKANRKLGHANRHKNLGKFLHPKKG
jgi:hypothetical protein